MERRVPKSMFKAKACELFRQVETLGEKLIVTDHGKPTIEIRRYASARKNSLDVLRAGIVSFNPGAQVEQTGGVGKDR
jgi:hypothetical protein